MSTLRNRVQLIGHVGQDPEIVNLESGTKLAKFSIATNTYHKNAQGEKVEETQWHQIVVWGKIAEIAEKYVSKGKEVGVEGSLSNHSYDAKDGTKRYSIEINCRELLLLSK